ncbi:transposase [bacterium]|nr:transposase [bacterium]
MFSEFGAMDKLLKRQPKAFRIVELGLDDVMVFFEFPRYIWRSIRTINAVETTFAHIRGKTQWFGAFNNINSARKLITMPVFAITQN